MGLPWIEKEVNEVDLAVNVFSTLAFKNWRRVGDFYRVAVCNKPGGMSDNVFVFGEGVWAGCGSKLLVFNYTYDIGFKAAIVRICYDVYKGACIIEVFYRMKLVASTGGFTEGTGELIFNYTPDKPACKAGMADHKINIRITRDGEEAECSVEVTGNYLDGSIAFGPPRIDERIASSLEWEFENKYFENAEMFAVARHYIIENEKKQRFGLAYVVVTHIKRLTLVIKKILNLRGGVYVGPDDLFNAYLAWLDLGKEFLSTYIKAAGCPLWYVYSIDDYYGPKIEIDSNDDPMTLEQMHEVAMDNIGKPLPDLADLEKNKPNIKFRLMDHVIRHGNDFLRAALDVENFNRLLTNKDILFYEKTMQSPIVPLKLRDTSIVNLYEEQFSVESRGTNWWPDTKVRVAGYFDEKSALLTLHTDNSPYFEYLHGIPETPVFFGEFEVPFFTDKGNWEGWDGNVALMGGTVLFQKELKYEKDGCCDEFISSEPVMPPDVPPITHGYDYMFVMRWEDDSRTDLDLHGFLDYSPVKAVWYPSTYREYAEGNNKMWLDYDYRGHQSRQDEPEIITVKGFKDSVLSICINNFGNRKLSEEVTLEVFDNQGNLKKKYVLDFYRQSEGVFEAFWVLDIDLSTGVITDKLQHLEDPFDVCR